MCALPLIYLL